MKIKHGFTLIELLAVIVILAMIALITIPIILNMIDKSRGGVYDNQREMIADAAELYYFAHEDELIWDGNISYVELGTLKSANYLRGNVINPLNNLEMPYDTKVLIYKKDDDVKYSLQLYDNDTFKWYQEKMVQSIEGESSILPTEIGAIISVDLDTLIDEGKVSEFRIPTDLTSRCVGSVEIEKISDNDYEYNAYVDCLVGASTFANYYVSYGGKAIDSFYDVIETTDGGYVAVGKSSSDEYHENINKGKDDAIIVKFKSDGTIEWSKNFGGSNNDNFKGVIETTDSYIVVGQVTSADGDLTGIYKGGSADGVIVKYNKQGSVTYKKTYGSSGDGEDIKDIIKINGGYVTVGTVDGDTVDGDLIGVTGLVRSTEACITKFNNDFNIVWRDFFVGSNGETYFSVIETTDNNFVVSGISSSKDYDMEGIGWTTPAYQYESIIVKYDGAGNLQNKKSFRGSRSDYFQDIVEVSDGYIVAGYSQSCDQDMAGLCKIDNGTFDAIIVKYDKNLSNIMWKKVYGGTDGDDFRKIIKINNDELVVVGTSKSGDLDMQNISISQGGYKDGILVKYSANTGNVITQKVFGGTNSDEFHSIIKTTSNTFKIAGFTFSNDKHLKNFNKGHSDAILVSYDSNFNLNKDLNELVVLIDKLKVIEPTYGSSISNRYDNLYTSNNPSADLGNWCSSITAVENSSNYVNGDCLGPYNADDIKLLTTIETPSGLRVLQGQNEYPITINADNPYNWHTVDIHLSGSTGIVELSDFKLKFADGYIGSMNFSVNSGYIEPLVTVSNLITTRVAGLFPSLTNIFNDGGSAGSANYPTLTINLKPKKSKLISIIFTSSKNSISNDGVRIDELRNFDMSITPTS